MEAGCFDDGFFGFIGRPHVTAVYSPIKQDSYDENGISDKGYDNEEKKYDIVSNAAELSKVSPQDVTVLSGILSDHQNVSLTTPEKYQVYATAVTPTTNTEGQFIAQQPYTGQQQPQQTFDITQQQFTNQTPYVSQQINQQNFTSQSSPQQQYQTVQYVTQQTLTSPQQVTAAPQQQFVITQQQYTNGIPQVVTQSQPQHLPNQPAVNPQAPVTPFQSYSTVVPATGQQGSYVVIQNPQGQNSAYVIQQNNVTTTTTNGQEPVQTQAQFEIQTCNTVQQIQQPDIHYMSNSDGDDNSRCSFGSLPEGMSQNITSSNDITSELPSYKCDICGSEFVTQLLLSSHKQKNHPTPHVKKNSMKSQKFCNECGASFTTKTQLEKHVNTVHNTDPDDTPVKSANTMTCPICGKEYSKHYYRSHMDYHAGKRYTCELCGIEFPYRRKLQRHKKFHENSNEFKCPIKGCELSFDSEFELKKHTKIHNDNV